MWTSAAIVIDHHVLAEISIAGIICDVMGGLYLAYDLLGGRHGPLRFITRIVTYTLFFCLGYSIPLGLLFGLIAGGGLGLALGLEFGYLNPLQAPPAFRGKRRSLFFGFLRGMCFGTAALFAFGWVFGLVFGLLTSIGLTSVYLLGFSPSSEFLVVEKPRLRPRAIVASIMRGISTGTAGAIAGLVSERGVASLLFGLEVGLVVGLVSAIVSIFSPFIEWWADNLPVRRLGTFGTFLLLFGLVLQSLQYWVTLFDIPVR